jgi:hypothetical protein
MTIRKTGDYSLDKILAKDPSTWTEVEQAYYDLQARESIHQRRIPLSRKENDPYAKLQERGIALWQEENKRQPQYAKQEEERRRDDLGRYTRQESSVARRGAEGDGEPNLFDRDSD